MPRYIYQENEQIERAPLRSNGDPIVIINRFTHMPEIGRYSSNLGVILYGDGGWFKVSPDYWEIAWP